MDAVNDNRKRLEYDHAVFLMKKVYGSMSTSTSWGFVRSNNHKSFAQFYAFLQFEVGFQEEALKCRRNQIQVIE